MAQLEQLTSPNLTMSPGPTGNGEGPSTPLNSSVVEALQNQIGKRISVVSKKDIRYEGLLDDVDVASATAAISRVRFWGTETRQADFIAPRDESYDKVSFRLSELKDIFAHVEQCKDMLLDPTVVECSMAVYPILWSNANEESSAEGFLLPARNADDIGETLTAEQWNSLIIDKEAAVKLLTNYLGTRNRISIISKSLIRYEGVLKVLDPATTQVSLVCVRFFGTEDRPAVKKTEARIETYPSVKFQLGEARDVKAFVKMCAEMLNDHAVIPMESTIGSISAPRKLLLPPSSPKKADSIDVANVNGNLQLRLPEISPRKEGGRKFTLQMPGSASSTGNKSSVAEQETPGSRNGTTSRMNSALYNGRRSALGVPSMAPGALAIYDVHPEAGHTPLPVKRGKPGRKRASSAEGHGGEKDFNLGGGIASGQKKTKRRKSGSSKRGRPSGPKRRSASNASPGGAINEPDDSERTNALGQIVMNNFNKDNKVLTFSENGGSVSHSSARSNGVTADRSTIIYLQQDATMKKFPCPLGEDCIEDYEGAGNVYHMSQHFARAHKDTHPHVGLEQFVLQCSLCGQSGFEQKVPNLKVHMEKMHSQGRSSSDEIPYSQEEEVHEDLKEDLVDLQM